MTASRDRIVDAALELFWFEGFEQTSLATVCERAEVNPGSLYYFFPPKDELLKAALDRLLESMDEQLLRPAWDGVDDPVERIFALLGAYRRSLQMTDFAYGCPIGSISLERRHPRPGVRERLAANFDGWTAAVRGCLQQAQGRIPRGTDLDALATLRPHHHGRGGHARAHPREHGALRSSGRMLERLLRPARGVRGGGGGGGGVKLRGPLTNLSRKLRPGLRIAPL